MRGAVGVCINLIIRERSGGVRSQIVERKANTDAKAKVKMMMKKKIRNNYIGQKYNNRNNHRIY